MSKQVITIQPGGVMSGLQVKPGKGLDLTKFGPACVQRASEIVWDDTAQKWFVQLTSLHFEQVKAYFWNKSSGVVHAGDYLNMTDKPEPDVPHSVDPETGLMLFDSYEDAVSVEIEFLNAARLKGLIV